MTDGYYNWQKTNFWLYVNYLDPNFLEFRMQNHTCETFDLGSKTMQRLYADWSCAPRCLCVICEDEQVVFIAIMYSFKHFNGWSMNRSTLFRDAHVSSYVTFKRLLCD